VVQAQSKEGETEKPKKISPVLERQPSEARPDLVARGLIAEPYDDSTDEEERPQTTASIDSQLQLFLQKDVHPAIGLKVAQGRKMLAESGVLDDLLQMRNAHCPRAVTTHHRKAAHTGSKPICQAQNDRRRPASAARRLPSHVVRQRELSPLYNQAWQEKNVGDPRFTINSIDSLTQPLQHRMPPKKPARSQASTTSTDSQLDDSVYTGHAFAGRSHDVRPASAPPGGVKLDFEALHRFNEAVARGEITGDVTFDELTEEDGVQSSSHVKHGLSHIDMLTAPEFEHIPINQLMPSLFGNEVVQRPHRGTLELAGRKLVEGKHAKVCDFTCRNCRASIVITFVISVDVTECNLLWNRA
jgi:hypothetical protein